MKKLLFFLSIVVTFLLGCNKDYENFMPNQNGTSTDTVWGTNFAPNIQLTQMYNSLQLPYFIDSITISNGGIINFPNNITINIPPNSFLLNGMPTNGMAVIKFILLKKKGDMIHM